MPHWECIEDASAVPDPVWLARLNPSSNGGSPPSPTAAAQQSEWKPLRKTDCRALNENEKKRILAMPEEQSLVVVVASTTATTTGHENGNNVNDDSNISPSSDNFTSDGDSLGANGYSSRKWCVNIEGGRCKADPVTSKIYYNFIRGAEREMTCAIWFIKTEEKSKNNNDKVVLQPISIPEDSAKIEELYQKAIAACSSFGAGINSVLKDEIILSDQSKVFVNKSGEVLTIQQKPSTSGWFGPNYILQRGYGHYEVIGEDNENMLGPIQHLVFIVHGIGEAFFSQAEFKYVKLSSIIDQTDSARISIQKKQVDEYQKLKALAINLGTPEPQPPGRIELIPIEWYSKIHDSSSALMKSLQLTTLATIPALRSIANDVVFDILMYMTPTFCESVLECVTQQLNNTYEVFKKVHPTFESSGGKVSLAGHSLGSVIVWDLLAILKDSLSCDTANSNDGTSIGVAINDHDSSHKSNDEVGYRAYAREENAANALHGTWGPSLTKSLAETIHFRPECTLFLGSPLGIFLTLRGAHAVFDEMRNNSGAAHCASNKGTLTVLGANSNITEISADKEIASMQPCPFTLPTEKLYNIFHPSDPVAYRLEPLLLSQKLDKKDLPPPIYLKPPGQDLKLHLKFKHFGDDVRKSLITQKSSWRALLEVAANAIVTGSTRSLQEEIKFPLGGKNSRVDCSLQPGVIENEYISAVLAHGCYLTHPDVHDFLISLLGDRVNAQ